MRLRGSPSGFSIVEVLVALVILGVGIFGAADVIMSTRRNAAQNDFRIEADALARLKIREMRASGGLPGILAQIPAGATELAIPKDGPEVLEQNQQMQWRAFVTSTDPTTSLTEVRMEISRVAKPTEIYRVSHRLFIAPQSPATGANP